MIKAWEHYATSHYLSLVLQEVVDSAPLFPEVLASFEEWLQKWKMGSKRSFAVVTDGPWDMGKFLKDQCMVSPQVTQMLDE